MANLNCHCCAPPWAFIRQEAYSTINCGDCVDTFATWRITFEGIEDGTNSDCTAFNGTHDMDSVFIGANQCSFNLTGIGGEGQVVSLAFTTNGTPEISQVVVACRMDPSSTLLVNWIASGPWDCDVEEITGIPQSFGPTGDCTGWPSTVDIIRA